ARADVALRSDLGVAQIREVHGLGAFADGAFLELDEIADARAGFQVIVRSQPRKRPNNDAVVEPAFCHNAMGLDGHVVAEDGVGEYAAGSNGAVRADFGFAQQLHSGFNDGVFARGHVRIDQHRLRQLDSDTANHQLAPLSLSEYAVDFGKVRTCVAAKHFARVGGHLCQDGLALGVEHADGVRQVEFAMLVV